MFHGLAIWFGITNGSGHAYLWWSGFFGDLTIFAAMIGFYAHRACHVSRCYRPGLHKVEGTPYVTCRKHHPAITHTGRTTAAYIADAHEEAH